MLGKLLQGRYQVVQILSVEDSVKPTLLKILEWCAPNLRCQTSLARQQRP